MPVSVVPQDDNKCNKRRGGWVGGWMTWLFIMVQICTLYVLCVWLLDFISNYETRESCPGGGAVRIFSGQPSSVSDPSSIAGWLQRRVLFDVGGRSVVEKRSILGGRLTFLQYWNLSGNLLAAM